MKRGGIDDEMTFSNPVGAGPGRAAASTQAASDASVDAVTGSAPPSTELVGSP